MAQEILVFSVLPVDSTLLGVEELVVLPVLAVPDELLVELPPPQLTTMGAMTAAAMTAARILLFSFIDIPPKKIWETKTDEGKLIP